MKFIKENYFTISIIIAGLVFSIVVLALPERSTGFSSVNNLGSGTGTNINIEDVQQDVLGELIVVFSLSKELSEACTIDDCFMTIRRQLDDSVLNYGPVLNISNSKINSITIPGDVMTGSGETSLIVLFEGSDTYEEIESGLINLDDLP